MKKYQGTFTCQIIGIYFSSIQEKKKDLEQGEHMTYSATHDPRKLKTATTSNVMVQA